MAQLFANNVATTLSAAITAAATSLTVTSATGMPALANGDYFVLTLDNGTATEIVKVTAISGTTLTVVRAQEGTTAVAWASGTKVEMRLTAGALKLSTLQDDIGLQSALIAINGV